MGNRIKANKPILSIGILVSKRPETIEKCLSSLHHLRETIPCQLILVETGCGDDILEYLKTEADVLDSFEWCNDFAKARNVTLKHATGEWFMFMDDDEWFENTNELEHFFGSGEYKKYGNATYKIHNYLDMSGERYMETKAGRLAKIHPDLRFQYAIHECYENVLMPMKSLNDYEHHYGYANEDGSEAKNAKAERNINALVKELDKDRHVLRQYSQLILEYRNMSNVDKCIELSEQAIKDFDPNHKKANVSNIVHLNGIMANHLDCLARKNNFDKVEELSNEYLKHTYLSDWGKAGIYCVLAKVAFPTEKYEDCMKYADYYFKMWKHRNDDDAFLQGLYDIMLNDLFSDFNHSIVAQLAASSALWLGIPEKALKYYKMLDINEDNVLNSGTLWKSCCQDYMRDVESCVPVCEKMLEDFLTIDKYIIPIAVTFKMAYIKNSEKFSKKRSLWKKVIDKHWEFRVLALNEGSLSKEEAIKSAEEVLKVPGILVEANNLKLWNLFEKNEIDNRELFEVISFPNWKRQIDALFSSDKIVEYKELYNKIQNFMEGTIYLTYFEAKIEEYKLRIAEKEIYKAEDVKTMLNEYSKKYVAYSTAIYNRMLLEVGSDLLPEEIQAALILRDLKELDESEKYMEMLECLKKTFRVMPSFGTAIKELIQEISEFAKASPEEREQKREMKKLAIQIKEQVKVLISAGEKEEAIGILDQLGKMIKEDSEMKALRIEAEKK